MRTLFKGLLTLVMIVIGWVCILLFLKYGKEHWMYVVAYCVGLLLVMYPSIKWWQAYFDKLFDKPK